MSALAGSPRGCSIKGRPFAIPADADVSISPGGVSNEIVPVGGGQPYVKQTIIASDVDGLSLVIDNNQDAMKFLRDLQEDGEMFPFTITLADKQTYSGNVQIVDKLTYSTGNATCPIKLGGGDLELQ